MKAPNKVLIIVPCLNEEESLPLVVNELKSQNAAWDILVIDDGSNDQTYKVAVTLGVPVVRHSVNLGIGASVQTGIRYAYLKNYDCAIQVDGDGQHPASEVHKVIQHWQETKKSIVIGSRFLDGQGFQSTFTRKLGILVIRKVIKLLTGIVVTDPTSGLRLFDAKTLQCFQKDYPFDYPEPVAIPLAAHNELSISEVAVVMRSRQFGQSSIQGFDSILYMLRVCFNIFFVRIRKHA